MLQSFLYISLVNMSTLGNFLYFFVTVVISVIKVDLLSATVEVHESDKITSSASATTTSATMTDHIDIITRDGTNNQLKVDPNGYVIFCPCMGRFGNQADHFLGSLSFAKKLNRTLVLPPWRTYKNVPFDEWFKEEVVQEYHRAVLAEIFMKKLAPAVWPEGNRLGWCWKAKPDAGENYCAMKEGNPFGPFWDGLGVNFDGYVTHSFSFSDIARWKIEYPGSKYPVIALKGAPASFPILEEDVPLQRYLQWSESIENESNSFIQAHFPGERFVGIHLRNGLDWERACEHMKGTRHFMASPQCLGYDNTRDINPEICLPSANTVISLTRAVVEKVKATVVYVATDNDPMIPQLQEALGFKVKVIHQNPWLPQIDLALLGKADHFIGNCISSFTSFVTRERRVKSRPVSFWSFSLPTQYKEEL